MLSERRGAVMMEPRVVKVALVLAGRKDGLGRRVEDGIERRRCAPKATGRRRRR